MWNNIVELSKGFTGGVVVGLAAPYVISNFGGVIWTDIKNLWSKMPFKSQTQPVVVPTATVSGTAPVVNG